MMGYGGFGMMGFSWIITLLLIGLIIYAVIKLTTGGGKNIKIHHSENNEALNILNQRYARGEISEEEYIKKKNILKD